MEEGGRGGVRAHEFMWACVKRVRSGVFPSKENISKKKSCLAVQVRRIASYYLR